MMEEERKEHIHESPKSEGRKCFMRSEQHIRKQLNLNSYICKRYGNKIVFKTKRKLTNRVLLCEKFTKGENIPL